MRNISMMRSWLSWVAVALISIGAGSAEAQTIRLSVDLSQAPRRLFHAKLIIPVTPGPLTLLYPKWIPGHHSPQGPIVNLTGLKFTAAGQTLAWRRDDVDMYAFHLEAPAGADAIEVELDYISPTQAAEGSSASAQLAVLSWNQVLLSPQGRTPDDLTYAATLRLPAGWKFGTALPVAKQSGETIEFDPVSLTTLVDSPVLTGAHFQTIPLSVSSLPPHQIDMAGDSESALEMPAQMAENYQRLVAEAHALFGAHHYRSYRFLVSLSDHVGGYLGLEHHESSDNRLPERSLSTDGLRQLAGSLLSHEFVHSWVGKYRRPAGLATPDFQQPMKGEMLWVYEGLTEYLGNVLAARSGLFTPEEYREDLASTAAYLDRARPGRTWRPLVDTAISSQILGSAPREWRAWRRGTDYYGEGVLIWLEADGIIRQETQGRRSLDDFIRLFYGGSSGAPEMKPYTFDDLVAALNDVAPYDWKGFFDARLNSTEPHAPLGGIESSGWKLTYTDKPNELTESLYREYRRLADFSYSIGLMVRTRSEDGRIVDAINGMPAERAGLAPGMKLIAVNGRQWSAEELRNALRTAKRTRQPIELLVENAGFYRTYFVNYTEGEKHPHLERDSSRPDLLGEVIKSRAPRGPASSGKN
ncbi:M61 family metallopeptidase [Polyangium jinanense]|uniref:M61 family metallopeptidase n=1 Tax=Polyangium jinanense TaxID=2829994 RepID=UPI002340FE89|nr:M61 family peptidase [Polyangium jinanense]MDC3956841.1 M61 family metallopeptidase [Polyangium jinanense]MDC3957688.1 M61 family metallopeptidase [Polyangium jinanense]